MQINNEYSSGANTFFISSKDLEGLKKKANKGCKESAYRIYLYYSYSNYNMEEAFNWLFTGAKLGDNKAIINLAKHIVNEDFNFKSTENYDVLINLLKILPVNEYENILDLIESIEYKQNAFINKNHSSYNFFKKIICKLKAMK